MLRRLRRLGDTETLNIVLLTLLTVIEALQILIIIVFVFSFIPIKPTEVFYTIYPQIRDHLQLERDLFFYQIFIVMCLVMEAAALFVFRDQLKSPAFRRQLWEFFLAEIFWLGLQFFAIFKLLLYEKAVWVKYLFYASMALSATSKFFWPEFRRLYGYFYSRILHGDLLIRKKIGVDAILGMIVIALIFPDLNAVIGRIFNYDRFFHMDSVVMAPGWAYLKGGVLNVDVMTEYGAALPIIIARVAKFLGGFDYLRVTAIFVGLSIIYFLGCYVFLKKWLNSRVLASFGVLLAIKLQMFQLGASPLIWIFPQATVVRSLFDLVFLFFILCHIRKPHPKYLWLAAVCCGFSLALMLDTGMYQTLAFYAYLFFLLLTPQHRSEVFSSFKDVLTILRYMVTPFVVFLGVLFLLQGSVVLKPLYWKNNFEYVQLFLNDWGALPVYFGLRNRQFFAFIMGLTIPVIYLWTMIFVGSACYLKRISWQNVLVVILCVYGLGLYHYYIYRSAVTSYYTVGVPFALVVCFWIQKMAQFLEEKTRRNVLFALLGLVFVGLVTNNLFVNYPNAFNIARNNWNLEKKFYQQESNYAKDVAMIDRLTAAQDAVPVLSSFEVKILMDANRKPFFYYFPLFESRHRRSNQFGTTYLFTKDRMKKTLQQFEDAKPQYVFFEKKLFLRQIPAQYYQHYETLSILLKYVNGHYDAVEEGEYLVALKRKG